MLLVVVQAVVAWRGNAMDPAAALALVPAQVAFVDAAACERARHLAIREFQAMPGWQVSAVCLVVGGKP